MEWARLLPRFREAERAMGVLAGRETWSRAAIDAYQLARLNEAWAHAIAHVPYYREMRAARGLPERFAGFDEYEAAVPVLRKETVRERDADFLSEAAPAGRRYSTGGSTGRPMRIFWGDRDHQQVMQAKYRFYASHGIGIFDPTTFLWGAGHRFAPGLRGHTQRLRERLTDRFRNRQRLSAYTLDDTRLRSYLEQVRQFRPTMLYGFSRAVHLLAREALQTRFTCDSIRLVVLSSEVATAGLIATVERAFGAPVVLEYGAAECPIIAGQDADGLWRVREDVVRVETPPREDGRYDVVVSVFANPSFPLLRYALEDVVDAPLRTTADGFAILAPVSGRNDELLLSGQGEIVHPTAVDAVFESQPAVRRYRVHQRHDGSVVARLELSEPLEAADQQALELRLRGVMHRPAHIELVSTLPVTSAGKHRAISSDLMPAAAREPLALAPAPKMQPA